MRFTAAIFLVFACLGPAVQQSRADENKDGSDFFERHIRPALVQHCYECHSEESQTREGGLLLDRESGWLQGGDSGKAVVAGELDASLLWKAVEYHDADLQMPPDEKLDAQTIALFKQWIVKGAPGPKLDLGTTEFSRLGDQEYIFEQAARHWAFQPVQNVEPPQVADPIYNRSAIDQFVYHRLAENGLVPSRPAVDRTLLRRLHYDLTGLPPTISQVAQFDAAADGRRPAAVVEVVDELLASSAFGEHIGRLWLDVARYADTDSTYRADTKTPYYFPFAFTYRDYVVDAFNNDKPFDQFIKEQLAADLLGFENTAPETAALGFLAVGPHANRSRTESIDDWIDLTTRGLMGLSVACARCHDHKYEPIPTADYYSLHGVFASVTRPKELDQKRLPVLAHYVADKPDVADYNQARAAIDKKIKAAQGKKAKGNNRPVSQKIIDTELAKLLTFHQGAPAHTMIVSESKRPVNPFIFERGDPKNRGASVPRRFLKILEANQPPFTDKNSGRLEFAERITAAENPLTARVFVNRVWGLLMGSHLVTTPSDFGLQGASPTHPQLLDWLTADFIASGWSTKHLVRSIVQSRTYQQRSTHRADAAAVDSENRYLWRANRKHLTIEAIRDTMLFVAGDLDLKVGGRAELLWDEDYTKRRAVYGYVNRFNLDPTLRAYDFPSRMQTAESRGESVVAPQALFTLNAPFVIDQAIKITQLSDFKAAASDEERIGVIFETIFQRKPVENEVVRMQRFLDSQKRFFEKPQRASKIESPWPLMTQAMLMSNELQYVD